MVKVVRRPYFELVESLPCEDAAAWEEALALWALGMARCLALAPPPQVNRSGESGGVHSA